jgi:DNA-binding NarL/FixJ family response regulator
MTAGGAAADGATTRCLIADDQAMVREGFAAVLAAQPGIAVVGQAADGAEAIRAARHLKPDVVLMDVRMPVMDGLEAARQILGAADGLRRPHVLMLTTFDVDDYVYEALRAGASGFLLKDATASELVHAVRVVAAGDALLAPTVTRRLIAEFARRQGASTPPPAALGMLPCQPDPGQAEPARPGAGGCARLRVRPRQPRRVGPQPAFPERRSRLPACTAPVQLAQTRPCGVERSW